jgi:hypothetical protein
MGDRVAHIGGDRANTNNHRGFLCHVDKEGVRLVCNEGGTEEWLGGGISPARYHEWEYRFRADGGAITIEELEGS